MRKMIDRTGSRSRDKLLAAVTELLEERESTDVTITDVVARAGVTRPTFYAAFADLPDAFTQAALGRLSEAFADERDLDVQPAERAAVMGAAIGRILQRLEHHAEFFARVQRGPSGYAVQTQIVAYVARELRENTPVSIPLAEGPLPVDITSSALAAGAVWMMLAWIAENPRPPVDVIATRIRDFIYHTVFGGLGAPN
ncbi:TetR/AcrR family transcriptional regulator [Streptomyces sp. NPDC046942]|uniref:TetR/AcrR family transcriptional regulator n=1 Tax=Streptomyces sp. NPDC046942 TaxID=3155137 RepID=UPI0033EAF332